MVLIPQFQNDIACRLICNLAQLLNEWVVLFASNRFDSKLFVYDMDLHSLRVVLVGAVKHFKLDFEAMTIPLDAKAFLVFQGHMEHFEVEINFDLWNCILNSILGSHLIKLSFNCFSYVVLKLFLD